MTLTLTLWSRSLHSNTWVIPQIHIYIEQFSNLPTSKQWCNLIFLLLLLLPVCYEMCQWLAKLAIPDLTRRTLCVHTLHRTTSGADNFRSWKKKRGSRDLPYFIIHISHTVNKDYCKLKCVISPGALAQKSCQPGKKCRKLKFSGKLLGCPLNTTVKIPHKSQRGKFFIQDGRHRH